MVADVLDAVRFIFFTPNENTVDFFFVYMMASDFMSLSKDTNSSLRKMFPKDSKKKFTKTKRLETNAFQETVKVRLYNLRSCEVRNYFLLEYITD